MFSVVILTRDRWPCDSSLEFPCYSLVTSSNIHIESKRPRNDCDKSTTPLVTFVFEIIRCEVFCFSTRDVEEENKAQFGPVTEWSRSCKPFVLIQNANGTDRSRRLPSRTITLLTPNRNTFEYSSKSGASIFGKNKIK